MSRSFFPPKQIPPSDEQALIADARRGDSEAINTLMKQYSFLVKSVAMHYFVPGGDADDVLQEGWIGLWKAIQNFDDSRHGYFSAFAKLCVSRQIVTAVVRATRTKHQVLNSAWSLDQPARPGHPDSPSLVDILAIIPEGHPENIILEQESTEWLTDFLAKRLTSLEWKVFLLRQRGYSYDSISQEVRRPRKTIDNALQRIRRKLSRAGICC
ncbi:MAG: sigma-70 family RNA polymerase sigma factor [Firmicutes bacterium]|nr:sigma-70 family RNA polymerase sigma factor [Bacillota bacterium]